MNHRFVSGSIWMNPIGYPCLHHHSGTIASPRRKEKKCANTDVSTGNPTSASYFSWHQRYISTCFVPLMSALARLRSEDLIGFRSRKITTLIRLTIYTNRISSSSFSFPVDLYEGLVLQGRDVWQPNRDRLHPRSNKRQQRIHVLPTCGQYSLTFFVFVLQLPW